MQITHYLYNTFVIEDGDLKVAIDPGGLFFYYFRFTTLIPKVRWKDITHLLITHADPDHYWHADRVAEASGAAVICNKTMVRNVDGRDLMLGPRSKGLKFNTPFSNLHTIGVDETIKLDGITVTGMKATHGTLVVKVGPFTRTIEPGPDERIGCGAIGYYMQFGGKRLVNLGDTILHKAEWSNITQPDVLMIPIGGKQAQNTMDEDEALKVVSSMKPHIVIPCHYNCPGLFSKSLNPADDAYFKREAEKLGSSCVILGSGDSIEI